MIEGIQDTVTEPNPAASTETHRMGIYCTWRGFDVEDVLDWLRILPSKSVPTPSPDMVRQIDSRFVLAVPWNETRLESVQAGYAQGKDLPPCRLVPVHFRGLPPLYIVLDGMHRSYVARTLGKPVKAKLSNRTLIYDTSIMQIKNGKLLTEDYAPLQLIHEQYAFYCSLGIEDHSSPISRLLSKLCAKTP